MKRITYKDIRIGDVIKINAGLYKYKKYPVIINSIDDNLDRYKTFRTFWGIYIETKKETYVIASMTDIVYKLDEQDVMLELL